MCVCVGGGGGGGAGQGEGTTACESVSQIRILDPLELTH